MSTTLPAGQGIYQSGNPITLEAEFIVGSTPENPATVVFTLRRSDDTLVTYSFGVDGNVTNPSPGVYLCALPTTWLPGQTYYEAVSTNPDVTLPGEFYVVPSSVIPPAQAPGPKMPPCTAWLAGEDLVGLPGSSGLTPVQLDSAAVIVSMLGYECFGRRWIGLCGPVTVRPPARGAHGMGNGSYGNTWYSWGYWEGSWGYGPGCGWGSGDIRKLQYASSVDLAGYPVSQVTQVKIDGNVLPTTFTDSGAPTYRLDEWRYLTRLSDPDDPTNPLHWPHHQRGDLDDSQPSTWAVSYTYGVAPPPPALEAARQLATHIMLAMNGQACQLPSNVRTLVRQGATIERITPLATELRTGATGMVLWDSAIASYNPYGLRRSGNVWSPDVTYPVRVGNE